jgi:hypothetical protein
MVANFAGGAVLFCPPPFQHGPYVDGAGEFPFVARLYRGVEHGPGGHTQGILDGGVRGRRGIRAAPVEAVAFGSLGGDLDGEAQALGRQMSA